MWQPITKLMDKIFEYVPYTYVPEPEPDEEEDEEEDE